MLSLCYNFLNYFDPAFDRVAGPLFFLKQQDYKLFFIGLQKLYNMPDDVCKTTEINRTMTDTQWFTRLTPESYIE